MQQALLCLETHRLEKQLSAALGMQEQCPIVQWNCKYALRHEQVIFLLSNGKVGDRCFV